MAPLKITKTILKSHLDETRKKHKEIKEFISRLKTTLALKEKEQSELEGAILVLHELLTGEKVK